MAGEWTALSFADAPMEIIDGDRGTNYPKQSDFDKRGHCLFLNAGNVTTTGFNFSDCAFITEEKDAALRKGKLKRHDVILTTRGTVGNVAYFDESVHFKNIRINSGMVIMRPVPSDLLPRFLYLFLQSNNFQNQVARFLTGSAQPQLPIRDINRLEIPRPPIPEQRAIAHILGTLDDKIELNRQMNETLEAMARAIFKSWFVDFDPVRAKVEGRKPFGMDAETAALFPDSFEDSELGKIPRGWRVVPLPEVIEVNPTRALRKSVEAPYLDMANMPTRGHSPDKVVDRAFGSGMRFVNGDTLVARITPCLENGKTAFVDFLDDGQVGWGSTEYIVLHPKAPLPDEFAYCLARSTEFRDFAIQSMTGSSGRQRVPAESLHHFRIVTVPKPVVELFGRLITPLFAHSSTASKESRTLAALRDTLLPKLISGEIRVKDAEKFAEAHV